MSKRKEDKAATPLAGPFNNPFGALKDKLGTLPSGPAGSKPATEEKGVKGPARAVVRLERKGHGGKEVTVVEHLELPENQREVWLKALKGALGCGGALGEEGALVLQGDQRDRIEPLLLARGVRKIVRG